MGTNSLDLGFVAVGVPGTSSTGAAHTSSLLIERLSQHHDLTAYVITSSDISVSDLPYTDRVSYELITHPGKLPHPQLNRQRAFERVVPELSKHELVHSYSSGYISELSGIETPTVVTLNSFLPVCPKSNLRQPDGKPCSGPSLGKCLNCITRSQRLSDNPKTLLKRVYVKSLKYPLVIDAIKHRSSIDAYHALAWHLVDEYTRLGFDPEKLTVIPHFYNGQFLYDKDRISDPVQLLYVGQLTRKKGVHILLEALSKARFDFELQIAGTGSEKNHLEKLTKRHNLTDRVEFLGFVPYEQVPSVYANADIFVYPGTWPEPFGRVFLEALASNTPVVTSDVGSAKRIVREGGVSYESGDEQGIREGIKEIMSSYSQYVNGCENRIQRFKPERVIEQFNQLYVETLRYS